MRSHRFALLASALLVMSATLLAAGPVAAQDAEDEVRAAEISYELGDFDSEQGDWPIVAVEVRGQLDTEHAVTVELWGADERLWTGTVSVTPPVTRFEVVPFVAVGDLVEVGIWQQLTPVESIEIPPPEAPEPPAEPEDEVAEEEEAEEEEAEELPPTEVVGERLERDEVEILGGASGGSGSGQLALSMILAIVVLAIVFRTPLPSASTQRWTK
jgi:hypothetical protein